MVFKSQTTLKNNKIFTISKKNLFQKYFKLDMSEQILDNSPSANKDTQKR